MTQDDPFAAFKPQESTETPPKAKRERKAKPDKKERKPRAKAVVPSTGNGVMVSLSAVPAFRHLTDDELKFTVSMAAGINELPKKSQQHVVAALARIFQ